MNAQTVTTHSKHPAPRVAAYSRLTRKYPGLLASAGFAAFALISAPALAQSVGAAQSFAILGGSSVNANGPLSTINGDVGVSPGTSITGFPASATVTPPFSIHNNDGPAINARAATLTLYNSLVAMGGAIPILPGLNGQTLGPGTYTTGAALLVTGGTLTLSGAGTYIFQITSSLTTGTGSNVVLNGVNPCSVFWQVTSSAALDGATFPGTVVAGASVTLGTGAVLTGRALAAAGGLVSLAGGNTVGGCAAAGPGLAATTASTVASPSVALGGSVSDTATLSGGGIGSTAPTGAITFSLYNNSACTGLAIFTSVVPVNGNGTYTSASFTPSTIGTYFWIANYGGDTNNAPTANVCGAANESVIVTAVGAGAGGGSGVPTLSQWAMIMLAGILAIAGFAAMRRQAR